ncbi:hypothetical protein G3R49_12530 [Shewanella sp. WXL01]|uniref:hypothetical protein n=1 Tax=Shewanella sp. WXL01 TaxID=2709721 RepID=UPI0014385473|nr:hypothetical protein [Shewanella sp. WXL01]NKF51384.1 hypothetical protein [Shewanella sp. WXL01]
MEDNNNLADRLVNKFNLDEVNNQLNGILGQPPDEVRNDEPANSHTANHGSGTQCHGNGNFIFIAQSKDNEATPQHREDDQPLTACQKKVISSLINDMLDRTGDYPKKKHTRSLWNSVATHCDVPIDHEGRRYHAIKQRDFERAKCYLYEQDTIVLTAHIKHLQQSITLLRDELQLSEDLRTDTDYQLTDAHQKIAAQESELRTLEREFASIEKSLRQVERFSVEKEQAQMEEIQYLLKKQLTLTKAIGLFTFGFVTALGGVLALAQYLQG